MGFLIADKIMMFVASASSFIGAALSLIAPPHPLTWVAFLLCISAAVWCLMKALIIKIPA